MTAPVIDITGPATSTTRARPSRMTWRGTVRAEAIRFRSLPANRWMLLATLVTTASLAGLEAAFWADDTVITAAAGHTVIALGGIIVTQLVVGVLGALSITSEYAHGSIVPSLLAVPRRSWLLSAKAGVLVVAVLPATVVGGAISFLMTGALLERGGHATQALTDPGVLTSILGASAYLTAIALIGLALGTLLRSTAGTVTLVTGGVYVLPELVQLALPASIGDAVGPYLPPSVGEALWTPLPGDLLSRPVAAVVLGAWLVALLGAAAIRLHRRDA